MFIKREKHPPYIHDLSRLAVLAELSLTPERRKFLDMVTDVNIEARYPDIKLSFYKKKRHKGVFSSG